MSTVLAPITLTNLTPSGVFVGRVPALSIQNNCNATLQVLVGPVMIGYVGPNQQIWYTQLDQQATFTTWLVITPTFPLTPVGTTCTITTYTGLDTVPPLGLGATCPLAPRPGLGQDTPTQQSLLNDNVLNLLDFGAVGDGVLDTSSSCGGSSTALSTTTSPGPFTAAMSGRNALLRGAGASGTDLWTTVTFVDSQHLTLGVAATTAVSGVSLYILNSNDFTALNNAMAAASAIGGDVRIPNGVYLVDCRANQTTIANVNGGVRIRGASREGTHLVSSGAVASSGSALFVANAGCSLYVANLTLIGPAQPNGFFSRGIWHLGTAGTLTVRRVTALGWETPIEADAGSLCELYVDYCNLDMYPGTPLGTGCISVNDVARYTIANCRIHDFGAAGSNQNHGIYSSKGAEAVIKGCRFLTNRGTGFCIQFNGGSATSPSVKISDCFFASDSFIGILPNATTRTLITGCKFFCANKSIYVNGFDVDVRGCEFDGVASGQTCITQLGATAASKCNISDSWFNTPAATGTNPIISPIAGSNWRVDNCLFTCNQSVAFNNSGGGSYLLVNCAFADDGTGHFVAAGTGTPTFSNLNANVLSVAVAAGANDVRGQLNMTTQTATIAAGTRLFTMTFAQAYGVAPIVLMGHNDNVVSCAYYVSNTGTASCDVFATATLAVSAGYHLTYHIIG